MSDTVAETLVAREVPGSDILWLGEAPMPGAADTAGESLASPRKHPALEQGVTWINDNDEDLACKELSIQDESRFRK